MPCSQRRPREAAKSVSAAARPIAERNTRPNDSIPHSQPSAASPNRCKTGKASAADARNPARSPDRPRTKTPAARTGQRSDKPRHWRHRRSICEPAKACLLSLPANVHTYTFLSSPDDEKSPKGRKKPDEGPNTPGEEKGDCLERSRSCPDIVGTNFNSRQPPYWTTLRGGRQDHRNSSSGGRKKPREPKGDLSGKAKSPRCPVIRWWCWIRSGSWRWMCFPVRMRTAQERSLLPQVLETVKPNDVWVDDRNFCTLAFLFGIRARKAFFVTRQHGNLPFELSAAAATWDVMKRAMFMSSGSGSPTPTGRSPRFAASRLCWTNRPEMGTPRSIS